METKRASQVPAVSEDPEADATQAPPPLGSATALAEVVYAAARAQAVKLIPEHLAKNVPVIFCGGVQINTPAGKPDFFAPRHMEIYSPGEGPPNDAMAAYRANLKTLILFDTKKPGEESKDEKK